MKTLAESIFEEMNRVRELISQYDALPGGVGIFGSTFMKTLIKRTEMAISSNDVVEMIACFESLKTCE